MLLIYVTAHGYLYSVIARKERSVTDEAIPDCFSLAGTRDRNDDALFTA